MRAVARLVMILALVAASCGDDAATDATSTTTPASIPVVTTVAAVTTEAPTATGAPPTTVVVVTTAPPVVTTVGGFVPVVVFLIDTDEFLPIVFGEPGDPNGSGCIVSGDILPDGVWMGFAEAVGTAGGARTITFDLACYFSGAAADAAANADFGGTNGAEEGFYIRNKNPKVFSVPIADSAQVYYVAAAGPTWFPEPLPLASWPTSSSWLPCPGESCAVWLYVNGGFVTGIVEQYLP